MSEIELLKLWKGLFFCMWQSDKPRTQQQLAIDLADLIFIMPLDTALDFLAAFWKTMAREWVGIDRLRYDSPILNGQSGGRGTEGEQERRG